MPYDTIYIFCTKDILISFYHVLCELGVQLCEVNNLSLFFCVAGEI